MCGLDAAGIEAQIRARVPALGVLGMLGALPTAKVTPLRG